MSKLTRQQDAYGQAMWDAIDDPQAACVIEREDGFVDVDHTRHYMSEFKDWAWHERQGLSLAILLNFGQKSLETKRLVA